MVHVYNQTSSGNGLDNHSLLNQRKNSLPLLYTHTTSDTRCEGVDLTLTNPLTPTGCPTIQFSSETICLGLGEDPMGKSSVSQDSLTSDFDCRCWYPGHSLFLLIWLQQTVGGSSDPHLRFSNLLLCPAELRETLTYMYQFVI